MTLRDYITNLNRMAEEVGEDCLMINPNENFITTINMMKTVYHFVDGEWKPVPNDGVDYDHTIPHLSTVCIDNMSLTNEEYGEFLLQTQIDAIETGKFLVALDGVENENL